MQSIAQKLSFCFGHTFGFFEIHIFYSCHDKLLVVFHMNDPYLFPVLVYLEHLCNGLVVVICFYQFPHIGRKQFFCSIADMINQLAFFCEQCPVFQIILQKLYKEFIIHFIPAQLSRILEIPRKAWFILVLLVTFEEVADISMGRNSLWLSPWAFELNPEIKPVIQQTVTIIFFMVFSFMPTYRWRVIYFIFRYSFSKIALEKAREQPGRVVGGKQQ